MNKRYLLVHKMEYFNITTEAFYTLEEAEAAVKNCSGKTTVIDLEKVIWHTKKKNKYIVEQEGDE